MADLDRRQFEGAGQVIVEQGRGERLALLVVGDLLAQRGADPLHHAAVDLRLDDHRVDHRAAILGDREIDEFDRAGLRIDRNDGAVRRVGENAGADPGLIGRRRLEQRLLPGGQPIHPQIRDMGDLGDRYRAALRPADHALGAAHLADLALQEVRADPLDLVAHHPRRARHRAPRHHHAARGEGAEPIGGALGVAVAHRDMRRVYAQFLVGDLRQRRLQPLAVRLDADHQDEAAIGQHPRGAALVARDDRGAARGEFGGAVRGLLGKAGKADADQPAVRLAAPLALADRINL